MTYARARLWLGVFGVGTIVVVAAALLAAQIPQKTLPENELFRLGDVGAFAGFILGFVVLMLPFDWLGGYLLPRWHGRESRGLASFVFVLTKAVAIQSVLFLITGLLILAGGRSGGTIGALGVVALIGAAYVLLQRLLAGAMTGLRGVDDDSAIEAFQQARDSVEPTNASIVIADHMDSGFTGGVVGTPGNETILVPRRWLESLSADELAVAIARRLQVVASGSRLRGVLIAMAWILCGFTLSTLVPGGGVRSVAQLVTTCCAFTLWAFTGLLILPTVSRFASYAIDRQVLDRGISEGVLQSTLQKLDRLQDDEPQRADWIERVFHPVPSIDNRQRSVQHAQATVGAWYVARLTLFLSWACVGLLSRAVHCNAGRPELWVLPPTD